MPELDMTARVKAALGDLHWQILMQSEVIAQRDARIAELERVAATTKKEEARPTE